MRVLLERGADGERGSDLVILPIVMALLATMNIEPVVSSQDRHRRDGGLDDGRDAGVQVAARVAAARQR